MIRSFPAVRFGLMIGVGGGVPRYDITEHTDGEDEDSEDGDLEYLEDIRLGDVVISLYSKSTEAVIQFDFGKSIQQKEFIYSGGKINKPPNIVLTAISQLQAQHEQKDHRIPELLSRILLKNSVMISKFQYPGQQKNKFFKSNILHVDGKKTCKICHGSFDTNLVERKVRYNIDSKLYYGIIGSADQVMKNTILRDKWAQKKNIIWLMDSFPCIVIRGICDYADSHKNKIWQPYAASTAAAYAKELLLIVPAQHIKDLPPVCENLISELNNLNENQKATHQLHESHYRELKLRALTKDQRECHQAFKTSAYEQHKNINPGRIEGTCNWVLSSPQYLHWWESNCNNLLWVSADPGCGKSVLAKTLIDHDFKASTPIISVCYFFFKDNDEQNSLATALCAILHQLFDSQPDLLRHALPSWETNKNKFSGEVGMLWRILMAATSDPSSSRTICIFDALDECCDDGRNRLIQMLHEFYEPEATRENWLKFLVTSRPYNEIRKAFQTTTTAFPHVHLQGEEANDQIHREIDLVVKVRAGQLCNRLQLSKKTQQRIEHQLLQMNHRTYLWLHLAIDDIESTFGESLRPDHESIQLIPNSVSDAYEKILNKVPRENIRIVILILHIVVSARRPLSIDEMAMALGIAILPKSTTIAEAQLNPEQLKEKIRLLCGLFVFIHNSRIYLIHQTARESLVQETVGNPSSKWHFNLVKTEGTMACICVRYLLMDGLIELSKDASWNRNFLAYSAQNWADHVRKMPSLLKYTILDVINKLYNVTTTLFELWFPLFWKSNLIGMATPIPVSYSITALHLAVLNGHEDMMMMLLNKKKVNINRPSSDGSTALIYASALGHYKAAEILLGNGANTNAHGGVYDNALRAASFNGHINIVQLLLNNGADVNIRGIFCRSALESASFRGHTNIVQMLLEHGVNMNEHDFIYESALGAASLQGHTNIVHMLLEQGANLSIYNEANCGALRAASLGGHINIVQSLLEKGADVNNYGMLDCTALSAASRSGHINILRLLLEKGADVNACDKFYGSAFEAASFGGYVNIVQLLLEKGAVGTYNPIL